jgi:CheY-like chemotaxis protein
MSTRATLLAIDDEAGVLATVERFGQQCGFTVVSHTDARAALAQLREQLTAGAQSLDLDHRIFLHVIEEKLKAALIQRYICCSVGMIPSPRDNSVPGNPSIGSP